MNQHKLFGVTNWRTFQIVQATDSHSAVAKLYPQKDYILIPPEQLTDDTVTHIMSCEYTGNTKEKLETYITDIDRILYMDSAKETSHYQIG